MGVTDGERVAPRLREVQCRGQGPVDLMVLYVRIQDTSRRVAGMSCACAAWSATVSGVARVSRDRGLRVPS